MNTLEIGIKIQADILGYIVDHKDVALYVEKHTRTGIKEAILFYAEAFNLPCYK